LLKTILKFFAVPPQKMSRSLFQPSDCAPEDIRFSCPKCAQPLVVGADGAGATIACPNCEKPIQIPLPAVAESDALRIGELAEIWREHSHRIEYELKELRVLLDGAQQNLQQKDAQLDGVRRESHAHHAEHQALKESLKTSAAHLDKLAQTLAEKSEETSRLSQRLNVSEQNREILLADFEKLSTAFSAAQRELETKKNTSATLFAEHEQALKQAKENAQQQETLILSLQSELTQSRGECDALRKKCIGAEHSTEQLKTKADKASVALAELQTEHQATLETIEQQTVELCTAKHNALAAQELLTESQAAAQKFETELQQTKEELTKTQEHLHKLRSERSQFSLQDHQTIREMSKVREQLSLVQFERDRLSDEMRKLKDRLIATQQARDELAAELKALKTKEHNVQNGMLILAS